MYPEVPLFRIYSAHDTQIANVLAQLDPSFNFTYIKYASNIYFELYQEQTQSEFVVKVSYNGNYLNLDGCKDGVCKYKDFMKMINK